MLSAFEWSNILSTPWDFHCSWPSNGQEKSVHLRIVNAFGLQMVNDNQHTLGFSMFVRSNAQTNSVHLGIFTVLGIQMVKQC